jgi:hypothetical protein
MKTLALLALFASFSASAAETKDAVFNFTFFGTTSGGYSMVACDYASSLAEKWMEALGAKNVSVACMGGIGPNGTFPLSLRATYLAPVVTGSTHVTRFTIASGTFPGDTACDFDTRLMGALLADFPNVHVNTHRDVCMTYDTPYSYDLTVTLP